MSGQETHKSEARDHVLNAAYGLFLQNGLAAVSMQQIAKSAGLTKATLYHHFRDKQDLFLSTVRLAITRNESALQGNLYGAENLEELVRELITYLFGDARADLQRLATDFRLHIDQETQDDFWKHYHLPWKLVQSAVERFDGIDPEQARDISRFIYGAASGLSQLYRFEKKLQPLSEAELDAFTSSILYGIIRQQQPQ